jgi:molecular chaperone GrpE
VLNVARSMMSIMDNYDRAFQSIVPETDDEKAIEAKYRATYDHMLSILGDLGVTVIETVGKEFDYELHQAVLQRADDTYDEGIVCEELQKGYVLNGKRLVRAAMVSVAA